MAFEESGLVRWEHHPELRHPVLIAAFAGWNDAGDAATLAVRYLAEVWSARPFATIDPEEFYDFTATRPEVRLVDGITRQIEWPTNEFSAASVPGSQRDAVLLRGIEPQLRWRTFSSAIAGTARALGVQLVVTLGALLADVPHTRPVRVTGTAHENDLALRLGLQKSNYEGPTGIVGVLHDACTQAGLASASLWATVPHYVHQVPSPKAALALVERSASLIGGRVNPIELQAAAETYVREVSDRVADDEDATAYVAELERADDDASLHEAATDASSDLAAEVERFLKDHGGS